MWMHTVLEIYKSDSGWPSTGDAADWIADGTIGYGQGRVEGLVVLTPLRKIL